MKVLAVKLRQIGDTVLWTSALQKLKTNFPHCELHVLTLEETASILKEEPYISQIHTTKASSFSVVAKLIALRKKKFDWLLGFHATTTLCRWSYLTGAKKIVLHHHSLQKTPLFSLPVPNAGHLENALLRDTRVLEAMGIPPSPIPPPKLHLSKEELNISSAMGRVALLPGASLQTKRLPLLKWAEVATRLKDSGINDLVMITDNALSREWDLSTFCKKNSITLLDNLTLRQVLAHLNKTEVALGNDSALLHIAASLGKKTLSFFGPTCYGDWHPYEAETQSSIRIEVACREKGPLNQPTFRYCTLSKCEHLSCLQLIPIEEIIQKTKWLITTS